MSWHLFTTPCLRALLLLAPLWCHAQTSLYDAEEAAYLKQFANASVSPTCRLAVENAHDQWKYRELQDHEQLVDAQRNLQRFIQFFRTSAQQHLARLEVALPPPSLRATYESRVLFLRHAKAMPETMSPAQVDDLIARCKALYLLGVHTMKAFAARGAVHPRKGTLRLTYEPPLLPVSYNLVDGSFTVKQSITTPFGSVTMGYTNTSGAKLLVIRSNGRERYFSLDQPFEVFVPATHGVMVRSDGGGTIVLEVVAR